MKNPKIPLKDLFELSSGELHQAFLQRIPEQSKNSITRDQKEKLDDLTSQLKLLKSLMESEDNDF